MILRLILSSYLFLSRLDNAQRISHQEYAARYQHQIFLRIGLAAGFGYGIAHVSERTARHTDSRGRLDQLIYRQSSGHARLGIIVGGISWGSIWSIFEKSLSFTQP